jgi:hypothetical protein
MEPLLHSGDHILVDISQRVPFPPWIFMICVGMGILAKRVEDIADSEPTDLVMQSVKSEYQTYSRHPKEVHINDRIIRSGRGL